MAVNAVGANTIALTGLLNYHRRRGMINSVGNSSEYAAAATIITGVDAGSNAVNLDGVKTQVNTLTNYLRNKTPTLDALFDPNNVQTMTFTGINSAFMNFGDRIIDRVTDQQPWVGGLYGADLTYVIGEERLNLTAIPYNTPAQGGYIANKARGMTYVGVARNTAAAIANVHVLETAAGVALPMSPDYGIKMISMDLTALAAAPVNAPTVVYDGNILMAHDIPFEGATGEDAFELQITGPGTTTTARLAYRLDYADDVLPNVLGCSDVENYPVNFDNLWYGNPVFAVDNAGQMMRDLKAAVKGIVMASAVTIGPLMNTTQNALTYLTAPASDPLDIDYLNFISARAGTVTAQPSVESNLFAERMTKLVIMCRLMGSIMAS